MEDMKELFGASAFDDKLEELTRLQRWSSVADYMSRFESLMNEVVDQSEEALINFFIGGLKMEIKKQIMDT